jgi:hypothetical protein
MKHTDFLLAGLKNMSEDLAKTYDQLREEPRAKREAAMLSMLRELEFSFPHHGHTVCCPICGNHREMGHSGGCRLRAVMEYQ